MNLNYVTTFKKLLETHRLVLATRDNNKQNKFLGNISRPPIAAVLTVFNRIYELKH